MKRITIENAIKKHGKKVKVSGFLENIRDGKSMAFLVVKDITGKIQVTIEKEKLPKICEQLPLLTPDSVVSVMGKILKSDFVKLNGVELLPSEIIIESVADALPINRKEIPASKNKQALERSSIDQRLDYRWIDLRTDENQLMFKVQTLLTNAMREFLTKENFIEIHSPKLIGAASEGGADVFSVDYFDGKAFLAQSPQFYKQMAMASGFERVFEIGPVFRAEKSYTNRHATEFTGFDIEMSYISSFRDVMELQQNQLAYALKKVKEKYGEEIGKLFGMEVVVPKVPFPVMTVKEVYEALEKELGLTFPVGDAAHGIPQRADLCAEAERATAELTQKLFNHEFLFVTDFDKEKRAFYHMRDDMGVPLGYDLLWKGCEITTGAQREHRYEQLKKQAEEKGIEKDVNFYLEFFRYGCPPHGGYGTGIDRLTMLLLGVPIKEVMYLFRGVNRLTP
ncbi:MAG: aspartate--tRNA(Asn) ligase [Firmicutes bacterium]|nr:aspartate--tRNA(Asn) ligase [Bacillota bacterium]